MKKKVIFEICVDNQIDLITNSSSELFVLNGNTKEEVKEMVKNCYNDYLLEYEEVKSLNELSNYEFKQYIDFKYSTWNNRGGAAEELGLDPRVVYNNYDEKNTERYWYPEYSEEGLEMVKEMIPRDTFFLFSIDENPSWDNQENLSCIAERFHLG